MEWLKIPTTTELVRIRTDEIVGVVADGNYSNVWLYDGRKRTMTFKLHYFDEAFEGLQQNPFVRIGRSLIINKRLGYCAMSGGKTVLGVARDEAVADFVKESGGSMFRQFVLVSDGEIPRKFQLHKKVERRALARMEEQLYYIESRNAETMWDFADAIRKYGFIDAIYITGGNAPSFYRTADGQCHVIGDVTNVPSERNRRCAPYLVFRK